MHNTPIMATKKVNIYFNDEEQDLYEKILNLSKEEKRSFNAQAKILLEEAIEARQQKNEKKQG